MTPDACREWRAALASAALERLDAADELALQAHLDGCAACRAELAELQAVARVLPDADVAHLEDGPVEPPGSLGDRVLVGVARERSSRRGRRFRRAALAVAAVLAVVLGVAALTLSAMLDDEPETTKVEFTAAGDRWATAELRALPEGTEVVFHVGGLDEGEWYWLWTTGATDRRVSAGTFQGGADAADLHLISALPLDETTRLWVTDAHDEVVFDAWLDGAPEQGAPE
jgi:anti-sigma factor RsiW